MLSIALAGKPNSGKSTFFKAATLADVAIANYPFTTIDANHGIGYVRAPCPCAQLESRCGNCRDGIRFVPIELIDVAGLVPDAHKGRGLGNAFLDHLRQAKAIIHVIDASGGTDIEGNPVAPGSHDPVEDVKFLEHEISMWMVGILRRNWERISRKAQVEGLAIEGVIAEQLSGAGVAEPHVRAALTETRISRDNPSKWSDEELLALMDSIRKKSKPLIIAANKADIAPPENIRRLLDLDYIVIPASAAAELALRTADKSGAIKYIPGDSDFTLVKELSDAQRAGLEKIRSLMQTFSGTGVQAGINTAAMKLLDLIIVYPVEDENKFSDRNGRLLPDAFLMKRGSSARDLAYLVHTDIGKGFLYAIDARTKLRVGEKHELKDGDVIKIVAVK